MPSTVKATDTATAGTLSGASESAQDCAAFLALPATESHAQISADILARIRDIGSASDDAEGRVALALSPDRQALSFVLRRGDPSANRTCFGLYVLPLAAGARPRLIDTGGEMQLATITSYMGLADFPTGVMQSSEPHWSPDNRYVAWLKRIAGHTAVWQAAADGSGARMIASLPEDIDAFAWSPDGSHLLLSSRPGLLSANRAIQAEAAGGYLYDERSFPGGSDRPLLLGGGEKMLKVVDLVTQSVSPATADQAAWMIPLERLAPDGASGIVAASDGSLAWRAPRGTREFHTSALTARIGGKVLTCPGDSCLGELSGPWWSPDDRSLLALRHGAQESGMTRFLTWTPATGQVRTLAREDAAYADCVTALRDFICLREDPDTPLQIVRVDPQTGEHDVLFDPNPEITGRFGGHIEHLVWSVSQDLRSFGHLTLPPGYRPGTKLPLIVVQYRERGFQRGGVGDEVPILPLANDGFAVLNVDRPDLPGNRDTIDGYMRAAMTGWLDERRALASIETIVRQLIQRGIVDPDRVGITGMSAGAQSVQFAMIHSTLFKAASMSTCCKDPVGQMVLSGPLMRATQQRWGLQPIESGNEAQWRDVSMAMNVEHIRIPILMQLPGWEYRLALETVQAFRDHDRPMELRVFPGDFHTKWQPAHRLAVYQRNIDWFDFWLRDKENAGSGKTDQYARWRQWKAQLRETMPSIQASMSASSSNRK